MGRGGEATCDGGKLQPHTTCERSATRDSSSVGGGPRKCLAHQASLERNCSSMQRHAASSSLVSSARPSAGARSSTRQSAAQKVVGMAQKWHAESARGSSNTSSSLVCMRTAMS